VPAEWEAAKQALKFASGVRYGGDEHYQQKQPTVNSNLYFSIVVVEPEAGELSRPPAAKRRTMLTHTGHGPVAEPTGTGLESHA
jgi:hypothetical protein